MIWKSAILFRLPVCTSLSESWHTHFWDLPLLTSPAATDIRERAYFSNFMEKVEAGVDLLHFCLAYGLPHVF